MQAGRARPLHRTQCRDEARLVRSTEVTGQWNAYRHLASRLRSRLRSAWVAPGRLLAEKGNSD